MTKWFSSAWNDIKTEVLSFVRQNDFWKKLLFIYSVYFVGFLSLIQANYLYKTDLSRVGEQAPYNVANWGHSGRWLNDLFTLIFHFDTYPRDISPLSQLLAIFVLSIASMILVRVVCKKTTYMKLLVSSVIGLCPYYLQVFSYVFDCLFYSIGVFTAIAPFLFYKRDKAFYVASAVGLTCCYLIFQSTISIYMVIVTYLFWADYQNSDVLFKDLVKKVFLTVAVFFVVSLGYYVLVQSAFSPNVPARRQSALCEWANCWQVFSSNFRRAITERLCGPWVGTPMGYAFSTVLLAFLIYQIKSALSNKRMCPKIIHVVVAIGAFSLMLLFILLWTMFFTFMYWNARIWIAVGPCFAVMMLAMFNEQNVKLRKVFVVVSVILTWGCVVFANVVGNLIEIQKRYESFVLFGLAQDLSQFPDKEFTFNHRTIQSPIVKKRGERYPILRDLATGMQTKYRRFRDYVIGFYRPELVMCKNKKRSMDKEVFKREEYTFVQINDTCIEVRFK